MTRTNRLNRFIYILLVAAVVLSGLFQAVPAFALTEAPSVNVDVAVVVDGRTGTNTYEKNMNTMKRPGSATKIMTALTAARKEKLSDSAKSNIKSMILEGSDSAARTLASDLYGSTDNFCKKMNSLAKELGCKNTKFTSVTGDTASEKHYTTCNDMSIIITAFMKDPQLQSILAFGESEKKTVYKEISKGNNKSIISNVIVATKGDTRLVAFAVGGASSKNNGEDCKRLLDYGFKNYRTYQVLSKGKSLDKIKVKGGKKSYVKVYSKEDLFVTLPAEGEDSLVKTKVELQEDLKAPVKKGTVVGKVQAVEAGSVTSQVDVVVNETVPAGGPWSKIGISDYLMIGICIGLTVLLVMVIVVKARIKKKKRIIAEKKKRKRELEAMRIAMERAEKKKRDWPY